MNELMLAEQRSREAWRAAPGATWAWCCHHSIRIERLTEPATSRIDYILSVKPKEEQQVRLNNFRPVLSPIPKKLIKMDNAYVGAHRDYDRARLAYDRAYQAVAYPYLGRTKALSRERKALLKAERGLGNAWKNQDKALRRLDKKLSVLHKRDVPEHTWNGKSIF